MVAFVFRKNRLFFEGHFFSNAALSVQRLKNQAQATNSIIVSMKTVAQNSVY
jgi:hypothetical protein